MFKFKNKQVMSEERNDKIKEAAKQHSDKLTDVLSFIQGALWADKHPDAISMNYLCSWYQCSVDETEEPIWTDKHIEELFNDFYLIPKK